MKIGGIDSGRIESMLAQFKAVAAQRPEGFSAAAPLSAPSPTAATETASGIEPRKNIPAIDFAAALKSSMNQVNSSQTQADNLGKSFALGNDNVSVSDVMIASQKASLSLQATVQVRNKLVSAYHDIMNMQV